MTNAELIQAIKDEIERLKAKYRKDMYKSNHEGLASGYKIEAYNELLSFLSTIESEKPMNLEEEINWYLHEECSDDDEPGIHEIAEHFAEWGYLRAVEKYNEIEYNRQRAEESVPKDLEEAANEYEKKHTYQRYDGGGLTPEYDATLAEAIITGYNLCKEKILKEAVDTVVSLEAGGFPFIEFGVGKFGLKDGDKVRVIVLKKED